MDNKQVKETLDVLNKIRIHCNSANCKTCSFIDSEGSCLFFNKPWEWKTGELEEKL